MLATSREPLNIAGERTVPIAPLAAARNGHTGATREIAQLDAVRLFVERAQEVNPDFALTDANAAVIAAICARLDGLPLAIELAAARLRTLPPAALLSRLERRLAVLTGGRHDETLRWRTMREAIAWSHDQLDADEQIAFRRASVFAGGFGLLGLEWILEPAAGLTGIDASPLDALASLVEKSLVIARPQATDDPRFTMLETIREFGLEQLVANGEETAVRDRLADFWIEQAEATWAVKSNLQELGEALDRLEADHDNIRAALDWLEERDPARAFTLAGGLHWLYYVRGYHTEGLRRLERFLEHDPEGVADRDRARVLLSASVFGHFQGKTATADARLRHAIDLARRAGDGWIVGFALLVLEVIAEDAGDCDRAVGFLQESERELAAAGDEGSSKSARYHVGVVEYGRGHLELAETQIVEILDPKSIERYRIASWALHLRGLIAAARGEWEAALTAFQQSLRRFATARYPAGISEALAGIALVAASIGRPEATVSLLAYAERMNAERGDSFQFPERQDYERAATRASAALSPAARSAAETAAGSWTLAEGIEAGLAVEMPGRVGVTGAGVADDSELSPRELEVLRLTARGMSDAEVGEALFISHRTVARHLHTVYKKLGVNSRTAASAVARRKGLLGDTSLNE